MMGVKIDTTSPERTYSEELLENAIRKNGTPSLQYLFFNEQAVMMEYRKGYSNIERKLKVDANTTFNAYSLTKAFTAVAILQLAEKGLLDINKPVIDYLPHSFISQQATVKQLLNHTAGVSNPFPLGWIHLASEHDMFEHKKFFSPLLNKANLQQMLPGVKFRYSNLGYVLLGNIIEAVSDLPYEKYITRNIIHALGIEADQLSFSIPHSLLHATGYHNSYSVSNLLLGLLVNKKKYMNKSVGKWKPFKPLYVNGAAYGGLIGTANAFVTFGQDLLKDESVLLNRKSKTIMFEENLVDSGESTGMCMAWFTGQLKVRSYRMHAGGGGGYYCELRLYSKEKLGSFITFNRSGFSNERWVDSIDGKLLEHLAK